MPTVFAKICADMQNLSRADLLNIKKLGDVLCVIHYVEHSCEDFRVLKDYIGDYQHHSESAGSTKSIKFDNIVVNGKELVS